MTITFVLLGISICAVWLPIVQMEGRFGIALWLPLFAAACASGLVTGYLTLTAIIELFVFGLVVYMAGSSTATRMQRIVFGSITTLLALALAMHRLPGFNNPVIVENIKFSADAITFTQYANFDKAAVGLILLALLCKRVGTAKEWQEVLRRTYPIALITTVAVIGTAIVIGSVKPEFKLPPFTPTFLVTNLLFTCVAEEAFFRGFLQERFAKALHHLKYGESAAILSSGALFGLVHAGGGVRYMLLATIAGIGSAYAYSHVRRIEAPIITHFALNAVHFIGFTYPQLQA